MRQSACRAGVDDHVPGLEATPDIPAKENLIAFRGRLAGFRISAWTGLRYGSMVDIGPVSHWYGPRAEPQPMSDTSFETALGSRVDEMLDACTRCGKCVESCPSVTSAGIADASPTDIISGILDILRTGDGPEASRRWASACMRSGECIKACDYGVNPRFLLTMARVAMAKSQNELPERRRQGLTLFRADSRDVAVLSQLQVDGEVLQRLGQKSASAAIPAEAPDFVFYTGCNVLKNPHIALLALDIMDALGVIYQVMGGPSHCCGIKQMNTGDVEMSGRMGANSIEKMSHSKSGQVISWCPSCYVQFTETNIPAIERQGGARPFEMTPFLLFLRERLAQLTPLLHREVKMRIALHRHPGWPASWKLPRKSCRRSLASSSSICSNRRSACRATISAFCPRSSASCNGMSFRRRLMPASTRWSASIIPIIANYARTNATGRSASSMCSKSSARAWACTATTATRSSS